MLLLSLPLAFGYGEVVDGRPTWAQRELHTLTNFVRVDPEAWTNDYACSFSSFQADEKTPKDPLYYHDGLTEIAQLHTEEMRRRNTLTHDSANGDSFADRVWPYYAGSTLGENVAMGYRDSTAAVFEGWMCSSGHRANLMEAAFEDLGVGVDGTWYTQDFGGGARTPHQPVAMGAHQPELPSRDVTFLATWQDGAAPVTFAVETDDACVDLARVAGDDTRGAWTADADAGAGCQRYRFVWTTADGDAGALPGTGSYQYGSGCEAWVASVPAGCDEGGGEPGDDTGGGDTGGGDPGGDDTAGGDDGGADDGGGDEGGGDDRPDRPAGDDELKMTTGCASAGGAGGAWLVLASLLALRRRRA